jgi:hypothetical protein
MIECILIIWFYLGPVFGVPLFMIGVILRLSEARWGKVKGGMGSTAYLVAGVLLFGPYAVYLGWALLT